MAKSDIQDICEELCRDCIARSVPDQVPFFETIWQAVHNRMFPGGKTLDPKEWELDLASLGTAGALGLHGERDELTTMSIISTICAVVIDTLSSESCSQQVVNRLLVKYGKAFDTPEWAIPHIKSLVNARIQHSTQRPDGTKTAGASGKPYLIWKNGKGPYGGTAKDVERLRCAAEKGEFDLFVNDAEQGELLVLGKTARDCGAAGLKAGEGFIWNTLVAMLERVGSRWTREDLFARIRPDTEYKSRHSDHVYQWIRHVKVRLDEMIESGQNTSVAADMWFRTNQRKRVEINSRLRACLIRRNPLV